MASAKYLEDALNADVDESAVNAIVGSLETQLVTTTPPVSSQQGSATAVNQNHVNSAIANGGTVSAQKHGVTNGGPGSINILNSDTSKTITTTSLQSSNVVHSGVVNTVVASLHGGVQASGFINQVTSSASQSNLTTLTKPPEPVKLVYPSGSQTLNSRVTFQPGALPNGNLGLAPLSSPTVQLNAVTSVQNVVTQTHTQSVNTVSKQLGGVISVDHAKTQGTTLVIKASGTPSVTQGTPLGASVVTVPMTVNSSMTLTGTYVNTAVGTTTTSGMSGVVTLAKPVTHTVGASQTIVGNPPATILPANVQIVNVNPVRPGTPGQQGQKNMASRVVIGAPHMVGARPGQPGQITLQTLQGLQAGTQGHLLLKTESGQYQLLRVGPAPTTPGAAIAPSATASIPSGATYRIQSVPAQGAVAVATTTTSAAIQATQPPALAATTQNATVQRTTVDTTKEKCRKFLANLLELSSREPKAVERNVRTLIQELIDTKVEPEEFCDRLERLLNASPQPCLIGFLKKSLPLLRQSLVTKELVIDGIRPPPHHTVVFSIPNSGAVVPQMQAQLRPQAAATTQVRLMTPVNAATQSVGMTSLPRPGQTLQTHRLVTPVRAPVPTTRMVTSTTLRPQSPITTSAPSLPSPLPTPVRVPNPSLPAPPLHVKQPAQVTPKAPTPVQIKTPVPVHVKPPAITKPPVPTKPVTPSLLPKPTTKEKEKKSFSSAGYTGDDDINDVAAMGGVNLAEETQRILGSTEFVGTQIRSCKDEIFLHTLPLQHRIRQIVARHGLDEPSPEVSALISHACQERIKNLLEKLAVIAEHRIDVIKLDSRYEVTQDVKGQLKFLEELDRVERKRHEEHERELLLRAAKSRSKSEVPEQAKLKAKAKEMLRAEMEELRQQEANLTALQAIGPRKKPKLEIGSGGTNSGQTGLGNPIGLGSSVGGRTMVPIRPRLKRVNIRDLLFLLEQEKETCRSALLYRAYLK